MLPCPDREQLERFLADGLDGSEEHAVTVHVQECSRCQHELEQLTGGVDGERRRLAGAAPPLTLPFPLDRGKVEAGVGRSAAPSHKPAEASVGRSGALSDEARDAFIDQLKQIIQSPDDSDFATGSISSQGGPLEVGPLPVVPGCEVLELLGRGGMGVVYRARQLTLGRQVALKMLHTGGDSQYAARLRAEASALARLQHPNIVQIHELGEHDGQPYLLLEYVAGGTLRERCGKPQDPKGAARLVQILADAIHSAHQHGITHRDLKPANVLLTRDGLPKISDFGLARLDDLQAELGVGQGGSERRSVPHAMISPALTISNQLLRTPQYMAPEQADRRLGQVGPAADVYALGVIMYELLTGRPPFDGPTPLVVVRRLLGEEALSPSRLQPGVPRDLVTICLHCLEKEPGKRYASALELREDLRRFLAGEPIRARRIGTLGQLARWSRRNRLTAASLAGIGAIFLTAFGLVSWSYVRSEDARQKEVKERQRAEEKEQAERWGRYRSNIAAAAGALQLQNGGTARRALDDAPPEYRNWEWQYLHNQLDGASIVLPVPGGKVKSLVLSPSGRQFAVCCVDHNEAYLYNVANGKLDAILRGHSATVTSVAYRPDGKQVATIGNDQTLRLWDPATGREVALCRVEAAPPNLERNPHVAYSLDGSRIASSAGWDTTWAGDVGAGTSRLWDARTGREIAVLAKWQQDVRPVVFSPDGKRLAVGAGEFVYLCDAVTGRRLVVLGPHGNRVGSLAYSLDGKRMASTDGSSVIHLWDGQTGKEVAVLSGRTAGVGGEITFSPDGSRLVSGSIYPENTARLWDADTGRLLFVLPGHKNEITAVAFSPDSKRVVTSSSDQTARLWDVRTGELLAVLSGHTDRVRLIALSPDGTRIITASEDATLRLWNGLTGELISVLRGHGDRFHCAPVFTPDGTRLVSGSADGTVRIWDMSLVERNGILRGHESYVYDVVFSPDGAQVASAAWDGSARLWDATTGRQTGLLKHETAIINSVAYSWDGRWVATAERERGITLWYKASQKPARGAPFVIPHFWDNRVAFNPAGTLLASGCADGPVQLWDIASGQGIARLDAHKGENKDVAFSPDGSLLATTGVDRTVRLWDVATHAPVAVLRGHTDIVWQAAFSPDGELLASCSHDKTIRLWDAGKGGATPEDESRVPFSSLAVIPLGSNVYGLAFSPDGTRLAAGCRDNSIRLIDVASREQVAELHGHSEYVHAVAWSPDGTRLASGSGDYTVRIWDSLSVQERARRAADTHQP
jgi:WD40 repeat protein